jgi:hypothetical protein
MLRAAGGESVAAGVDPAEVARAVDDVARLANAVRAS